MQKDLKNVLKYLKNELDKRAIKLNYMKLDVSVIMRKKYSKEHVINGLSFLTKSGRILGGGGGLIREGERLDRIITLSLQSFRPT